MALAITSYWLPPTICSQLGNKVTRVHQFVPGPVWQWPKMVSMVNSILAKSATMRQKMTTIRHLKTSEWCIIAIKSQHDYREIRQKTHKQKWLQVKKKTLQRDVTWQVQRHKTATFKLTTAGIMQPQKHMRQSKLDRNYKETKALFKSLSIVLFSFFNPAVPLHRGVGPFSCLCSGTQSMAA